MLAHCAGRGDELLSHDIVPLFHFYSHILNSYKKTQVYSHNVLTTWNRLLSDDNTAADAAAGCERPQLCYNDGGIYTV